MPTLHIQHAITDFDTWASAFNHFADARRRAGIRAHRVQRPLDNPNFLVIDLDFDSTAEAAAFRRFLETQVWGIQENAASPRRRRRRSGRRTPPARATAAE